MIFRKKHRIILWSIIILVLLRGIWQVQHLAAGKQPGPLVINEFMALNTGGLLDEDGDHSDWIEIYNRSERPIELGDWYLSDNPGNLKKWQFPAITLAGGDYLLIYASGKDRKSDLPGAELHTNFKLSRQGEFLALSDSVEVEIEGETGFWYPKQRGDVSYGRFGTKGDLAYLIESTPGYANVATAAIDDAPKKVKFGVQRGFYETPFTLELQAETPDLTIIYTTDGNEPSLQYGSRYTQPIPISKTTIVRAIAVKPDALPSKINTHTYIFLGDVVQQSSDRPGSSLVWGGFSGDYEPAQSGVESIMAGYEMDRQIGNDSRSRNMLKAGLVDIPTISLVMDDAGSDIFLHPTERGSAWERPLSVELIHPGGEKEGFQVNAGIRIQGGKSREDAILKHSFRLYFRNQYGPAKLKYPLFPDSPVDTFNTLVLRGGVDETFAGTDPQKATYTKDQWLRTSQIEMSGSGSHGIFVHLYLNGTYWGLYNLVERPDADFAASYFGASKKEWYARNHRGAISGDNTRLEAVKEQFINAASIEEKYAAIEPVIDFAQFSDYVILNWYAGNTDWGGNNWFSVIQNPAGKARYFVWDGEMTWAYNPAIYFTSPDEPDGFTAETIFYTLITRPDFKIAFADRIYANLFNDGPLTDARTIARWEQTNRLIDKAIVAEAARWGDARSETRLTRDDWLNVTAEVAARMAGNRDEFITEVRMMGFYPLVDPPTFKQHGGLVPQGFQLTLEAASGGAIYYTLDGSDPREWGSGAVAPSAQVYQSPIPLGQSTRLKARALDGDAWSPLNEATFYTGEPDSAGGIVITEIMYNPLDGDKYEFIELKNTSMVKIDLSNMRFKGIDYLFPQHSSLSPGEYLVLVGNPEAFAQRYAGVPIGGVYRKNLSNKGETIALKNGAGQTLVSVTYDDEAGWPLSPDGWGDSLVILDPAGDPNNPRNWRASPAIYGSPGAE